MNFSIKATRHPIGAYDIDVSVSGAEISQVELLFDGATVVKQDFQEAIVDYSGSFRFTNPGGGSRRVIKLRAKDKAGKSATAVRQWDDVLALAAPARAPEAELEPARP